MKASDLIRQGRHEEVWQQYCGFLDLTIPEFMNIQERLLHEQLELAAKSEVCSSILGKQPPASLQEFRDRVRLTSYEDYDAALKDRKPDGLAVEPVVWAHTSGRSGSAKWVPYGPQAYQKLGETMLAAFMLCTARHRGEVRLRPKDIFVFNSAPRPYFSGYAMQSITEMFDFEYVPPLELSEDIDFQERINMSFRIAMRTGMDIMASISSVMMRVGEGFAQGGRSMSFSKDMLHPAVIARVVRGLVRSKLEGRPMMPRDLWTLKGVMAGGSDTAIFRPKLREYWGLDVHESYGCTETGMSATQAWDRRGLYFFPDVAFYEFIPEDEWERSRHDENYIPRTVLIDKVQPGNTYELVVTNFGGGPFLRYRTFDLLTVATPDQDESSIPAPSFFFKSRAADMIDLAGFTGLIDERSMFEVILQTELPFQEWSVRKEVENSRPVLSVYMELKEPVTVAETQRRLSEVLCASNQYYQDIHGILGYDPLRVTLLPKGTFAEYMRCKQAAGADMAHFKPSRMNASDAVIGLLTDCAKGVRSAAGHAA